MFLLIDNYDSFTFNLVQAFQRIGLDPVVLKNDDPSILDEAGNKALEMVCISPGPSRPENAGLCLEFLERLPAAVPVIGVCLGHQILGHFAGAPVIVNQRIMHGKTSPVEHDGTGLFTGVPNPFEVGRYHSLVVDYDNADAEARARIEVNARTPEGEVMGLRYTDRPWAGVQFHPESVLTPEGETLLANFPAALVSPKGDA